MKVCYAKRWGFEDKNASAGFEFGRRDDNGKLDWPRTYKWEWLDNIISFVIALGPFEVLFRFCHPDDWRFWALCKHSTRGDMGRNE